jgi:hypothetical protein
MGLILQVLGVFNPQAFGLKSSIVHKEVTTVSWEPGTNDVLHCCQRLAVAICRRPATGSSALSERGETDDEVDS